MFFYDFNRVIFCTFTLLFSIFAFFFFLIDLFRLWNLKRLPARSKLSIGLVTTSWWISIRSDRLIIVLFELFHVSFKLLNDELWLRYRGFVLLSRFCILLFGLIGLIFFGFVFAFLGKFVSFCMLFFSLCWVFLGDQGFYFGFGLLFFVLHFKFKIELLLFIIN